MSRLSIVIPAYNEAATIHLILDKIGGVRFNYPIEIEIIVVNDCSNDGTTEALEKYRDEHTDLKMLIHRQEVNQGKGAAIHKGIDLASGDYIIIQDADLEYDPADYNILLKPLISGVADVVYGSRFMGIGPHRILFFWHSIGNQILTFTSNMFTNLNLTDMETCYKIFRADILKKLKLTENRFGFEPEVTARISRVPGIRLYEVGISYYGRTYDEGKKITARDGFRALYCILKYNLFDRGLYRKS